MGKELQLADKISIIFNYMLSTGDWISNECVIEGNDIINWNVKDEKNKKVCIPSKREFETLFEKAHKFHDKQQEEHTKRQQLLNSIPIDKLESLVKDA